MIGGARDRTDGGESAPARGRGQRQRRSAARAVIPLRRRGPEPDEEAELSPITPHGHLPTGVFDPPADPEPPEGYSVWEQPIAKLIRRGEPEPTSARLAPIGDAITRRPRILAAVIGAVVFSCLLALALSGWLTGPRSRPTRVPLGVSASVGGIHPAVNSAKRSHTQSRARQHTRNPARGSTRDHAGQTPAANRTTRSEHGSRSATPPATQSEPVSARPQRSSGTPTTTSSEATATSQGSPAQIAAVPPQATAAHEFGFER